MDMHSGRADAPQSDATEQLAVLEPDPLGDQFVDYADYGDHEDYEDYEETILRSVN